MRRNRDATPVIFVLFGAAGDLSQRLVLRALHGLHLHDGLPQDFLPAGHRPCRHDHAAVGRTIPGHRGIQRSHVTGRPPERAGGPSLLCARRSERQRSLCPPQGTDPPRGTGAVMASDASLFMRADQVGAAWRLLTPVLESWAANPPGDFPNYASGSRDPESTEVLIAADGFAWYMPEPGRQIDE